MSMAPSVARQVYIDAEALEAARLARMAGAWAAYYGQMEPTIRVAAGQPDDNVVLNFARLIVDKGAGLLVGDGIEFLCDTRDEEEQGQTGDGSAQQDYLDAVWKANHRDTLLHGLAINGGVCGQAWIKIIEQPGKPPRLINLDPQSVRAYWDPSDYQTVTRYELSWHGVDQVSGKVMAYRQTMTPDGRGWAIRDEQAHGDGRWVTTAETEWRYSWAPVIGCQNMPAPNEYYGASDIDADLLGVNRAINAVMTNIALILRHHAHPKTYATGWTPGPKVRVGVDDLITLPMGAAIQTVEMKSDLGSSLQMYERLKSILHEIARIPEVATGKLDGLGGLSGIALKVLYTPMVEKTIVKQRTYGDMLADLNARLLEMGGYAPVDVIAHWPEIVPQDPYQEAQTAVLKSNVGFSRDTLIEEMGGDPAAEAANREADTQSIGQQVARTFVQGASGVAYPGMTGQPAAPGRLPTAQNQPPR